MASQRELWAESFLEDEVPALPCPRCDRGNLQLEKDSLKVREPTFSEIIREEQALLPTDGGIFRFVGFLKCAVTKCGQIVSMQGDAKLEERAWVNDFEEPVVYRLYPKGMHPAPPLSTIPTQTPDAIADELRLAFQLFWVDIGSCANRLRISVEKILDEFGVPKGKLFDRIQTFQNADPDHAKTFDALRYVGNVGSHDGNVRREVILDAFEIYQDALAELFGKRKAHIDALKQKIISTRGK